MKMYGVVNIVGGLLLGLAAMPVSLLSGLRGHFAALAICMALSSVGLFISGTLFLLAACCQARAPKAEECA